MNYEIIHQKLLIANTSLNRLVEILARPFEDILIEDGKCFIPHHAIIIYKNRKAAFINICFAYSHIATSKDIKITNSDFDRRKWKELADYFVQKGITYDLVESDE